MVTRKSVRHYKKFINKVLKKFIVFLWCQALIDASIDKQHLVCYVCGKIEEL